ncbi:MAG: diguanylate cyclase [Methylophilaceae bacterium]|uniref:sensor domain-containing diguanylate cyclase n=1 Tax=Methylovorus sp. MM2 TaxID=1848038 RepID=UPI0007E206DE|nr:diguanylate cyclase [Methylovorus sp. MM2]OAM51149.1 diguanylate cyclase [Methylovorus sp. MM2]
MNRHKLLLLLTLVLATGFIATSFVSYHVSKLAIHDTIVDNELPLTADNVYSEIQKDLVRPVFISSMMASDTFLRDWVIEGEHGTEKISKYLQQIKENYGAFVSFLVTDRTHNYYSAEGLARQVHAEDMNDRWYFRVRNLKQPYEINVDKDQNHHNALTIFVNYRVLDYDGRYIGVAGVGLTVDSVQKLIATYQEKYKRDVYFVNADGIVMLSGNQRYMPGTNIRDIEGLSKIAHNIADHHDGSYEYEDKSANHLINVRYIPELKWYLFVDKSETDAISGITNTLYINLLLCLIITGVVVVLTDIALKSYQRRLEVMATTDILTGLPNRRAFDIVIEVIANESVRNGGNVAIIVLDIDHFKKINDKYGHIGGDYVLSSAAKTIKSCMRAADFVCRWGGEEFLIVVKDCDERSLLSLAEKVRAGLESKPITYKGQEVIISASLGAAIARAGETIEHIIERADKAMYKAKGTGRNRALLSD